MEHKKEEEGMEEGREEKKICYWAIFSFFPRVKSIENGLKWSKNIHKKTHFK